MNEKKITIFHPCNCNFSLILLMKPLFLCSSLQVKLHKSEDPGRNQKSGQWRDT